MLRFAMRSAEDSNYTDAVYKGSFTGGYLTGDFGTAYPTNFGTYYIGGGVYVNNGTFNMTGGTILGNPSENGGGVCIVGIGNFTMTGGAILGNTADDFGGGVYNMGGTFEINNGEISHNLDSSPSNVFLNSLDDVLANSLALVKHPEYLQQKN